MYVCRCMCKGDSRRQKGMREDEGDYITTPEQGGPFGEERSGREKGVLHMKVDV